MTFQGHDDLIDSRDVIEFLATETAWTPELLAVADGLTSAFADYCPDWQHGVTIISDFYFEDYAAELADDLYGNEAHGVGLLWSCIDWAKWADMVKQDYTAVEIDGVTYWAR